MKSNFGDKFLVKGMSAIVGITMGFTFLIIAGRAEAIPAFARTYKTECTTCHTIIPQRNEFGEAFEKNGFVWPGKKSAPKPAISQNAKGGSDEALFLAGLPTQIPVSFLGEVEGSYNRANSPKLDVFSTEEFEVLTAGAFRDVASWWAGFEVAKSGDNATETDMGELYAKFRVPVDMPFFVKVGRFNPTLSLWKENNHATTEKFGFIGNQVGVTESEGHAVEGLSETNITSWQTDMAEHQFSMNAKKDGIELSNTFGSNVYAALGVLNSKSGNNNDYYGHISVRLFGTDFLGKEPKISLSSDSFTDFLTVTLGGYAYHGSWTTSDPTTWSSTTLTAAYDNTFTRGGIESEILFKSLRVSLGAGWGDDDNLYGDNQSRSSSNYLAQAQYSINSKLVIAGRYERLQEERADNSDAVTRIYSPALTYSMLQNLKLSTQYLHKDLPDSSEDETIAQILLAF